jgi:hypothetical protein
VLLKVCLETMGKLWLLFQLLIISALFHVFLSDFHRTSELHSDMVSFCGENHGMSQPVVLKPSLKKSPSSIEITCLSLSHIHFKNFGVKSKFLGLIPWQSDL